jgi:biopolymer transport protein ExbB
MQSWVAFMEKAGPIGIAIILCSIIALFIIIERVLAYRSLRLKDPRLFHRLRKRAQEGQFADAATMVRDERHPWAVAMTEVLARLDSKSRSTGRVELEKTFGHAATREVRKMERFLPTLYLIASISPLLGLLGTVAGMIKAFQAIENLGGKVDSSVLAGGIWEAMLTTALGLGVAIPAMVAHNYLQGKVHAMVADMKEETGVFLDALEDADQFGVGKEKGPGKVHFVAGGGREVR